MNTIPHSKGSGTRFFAFDIETASLPRETLEPLLPEFDASEVKLGNTKDPDKVLAIVETARIKHREKFFSEAALNPLTGRVVAVGLAQFSPDGSLSSPASIISTGGERPISEKEVISGFWDAFEESIRGERTLFVGHNIEDFDLPFLVTRSRLLDIKVPSLVIKPRGSRFYFSERFIDTRSLFALGRDVRSMKTSLGHIAPLLGIGSKSGNGADFASLLETDPKAAFAYLLNDLGLTARLAAKLGVFDIYGTE